MMGQKETTAMTVATEEIGGGTLRRMILVLAAAALMAAMMVALASPAFAQAQVLKERGGGSNLTGVTTPSGKFNLSGHFLPAGPQGSDGGGANVDHDAQFGGVLPGQTVTTPSGNSNGTFHS